MAERTGKYIEGGCSKEAIDALKKIFFISWTNP